MRFALAERRRLGAGSVQAVYQVRDPRKIEGACLCQLDGTRVALGKTDTELPLKRLHASGQHRGIAPEQPACGCERSRLSEGEERPDVRQLERLLHFLQG